VSFAFEAAFHQKIEETFFAGIRTIYPTVKIHTPNARWIEPLDEKYFSLSYGGGEAFNVNIGDSKIERHPFVINIAVYCPNEAFDRAALEYAEAGARIFANSDLELPGPQRANFRAPTILTRSDPKTGKFCVIGRVPGWRDVHTRGA
jgi:hypothetical protein